MASWLTPVAACPRALTCSRHASLHKARQFSAAPEKWGAGRPPADKRCNPGRQDEPEGRSGQPLPFPPPPRRALLQNHPHLLPKLGGPSPQFPRHQLSSPTRGQGGQEPRRPARTESGVATTLKPPPPHDTRTRKHLGRHQPPAGVVRRWGVLPADRHPSPWPRLLRPAGSPPAGWAAAAAVAAPSQPHDPADSVAAVARCGGAPACRESLYCARHVARTTTSGGPTVAGASAPRTPRVARSP